MKRYVIIAGVNGAGKSTLYQISDNLKNMPRVNVDEIVNTLGDWRNTHDVFAAGKIAVNKISQYMNDGLTFNQETTLCGKSIINNIFKAKERGLSEGLQMEGMVFRKRILRRDMKSQLNSLTVF